jgi:ribosomal protein L11 methyltransferase
VTRSWALRTNLALDDVNVHLAALEAAGLQGIVEEGGRATVYLPQRRDDLPVAGDWEEIPDTDWHARWRAGVTPVTVGAVTVAPPWLAPEGWTPHDGGGDDHTILIEPGQAFGTGHHETTAGCLDALQRIPLGGARVLDVGTGSGVLAIAASRLGAAAVVGIDTDPIAVETAVANAEANGVAFDVRVGSVGSVDATFDVVVANLDTATLGGLAGALVARLGPGGTLVASGVSVERADEAVAAFDGAGLPVDVRARGEWIVLTGVAPAAP